MNTLEFTAESLQRHFDTSIEDLQEQEEDNIEYLEQNHYGDLLIEETRTDNERFKLWRNLDCNGGEIEIEFCGALNGYVWETILTLETSF